MDTTDDRSADPAAERTRRLAWSVAVALLGLLVATRFLDTRATAYSDGVFGRALATFASARALDAAISLAQGTELALQPAGVGLTVSAGEILDPINDLVEQFASLMLISTVSLGVQSLLLRASSWWLLSAVVVMAALARLAAVWMPHRIPERGQRILHGVLVVALALRFLMPLYAVGSALFFDLFLAPAQEASVRNVNETRSDIESLDQLDEDAETLQRQGWMERLSDWFSETVTEPGIPRRIVAFQARVAEAVEHVITLIVVFTMQTILLPLAFLWMLPRLLGAAFERLR